MQANHNKPTITQTSQTTRKSPARLAFRQKKQHAKRARAQTKTPIKGFAIGHSGLTTASHSVPAAVLWCCEFVLAFGGCCCLSSVPLRVFALVGWLLRFGPSSPGYIHPLSCPPLGWSSGAFWSSQCSAGPSLRVSGCICNGPVVIPLTALLLPSLLLMATKTSGFCPMLQVLFRCS